MSDMVRTTQVLDVVSRRNDDAETVMGGVETHQKFQGSREGRRKRETALETRQREQLYMHCAA